MARKRRQRQFSVQRPAVVLLAGCLVAVAVACGSKSDSPEDVVRDFVAAMQQSASDERRVQDAYPLLAVETKRALEARAASATSLAGREVAPWEMIVPGRFRLRFEPKRYGGFETRVDGDVATVDVRGSRPEHHAVLKLHRESAGWRIALEVPAAAR
jgi:hypothetical protein